MPVARWREFALIWALGYAVGAHAQDLSGDSPEAWLARMASAAKQLSYEGTFTYRYGNFSESSRIVHALTETGEVQKIELLDGPAREIIRTQQKIWCYIPDAKTVKIDRAETRRFFPSLIPDHVQTFAQNYRVLVKGPDRVAGRECRVLALLPRDALRYGYKLCADRETGLLLRASMVRGKDEVLEQFVFSEIRVGPVSPERVKPTYEHVGWRQETSSPSNDQRWQLKSLPVGFREVMQLQRRLVSRPNMVTHWLLSDGLAAVSVFIEPRDAEAAISPRPAQQGPVSVYSRAVDNHLITVLGEVPPDTVVQIANSVALRAGE